MSDFKENAEKLNVRGIVMTSIMTAFGLVVALSWKDASGFRASGLSKMIERSRSHVMDRT